MKTILLVDDDAALRCALSKNLARAGYTVVQAADGREALSSFNKHAIDLVVTDLIMPGTEGIELIISLRKTHPKTRVIAISGGGRNSPKDYLPVARALGATETLVKPFLPEELLASVKNVLDIQ